VVVGQVQGQFDTQEDRMARYLEQLRKYQSYFDSVVVTKIPREENTRVDELSKLASGIDEEIEALHHQIIVLFEPSISPKSEVMELDAASTEPKWATDIIQYLKNVVLPETRLGLERPSYKQPITIFLEEYFTKKAPLELLLEDRSRVCDEGDPRRCVETILWDKCWHIRQCRPVIIGHQ
jgi:hypothetical protein